MKRPMLLTWTEEDWRQLRGDNPTELVRFLESEIRDLQRTVQQLRQQRRSMQKGIKTMGRLLNVQED